MSKMIKIIEQEVISRRRFLIGSAYGVGALTLPLNLGFAATKADVTLSNSFRTLGNAYYKGVNKGGEMASQYFKRPYVPLVTGGNSEKGIADIQALIAKTGGNVVFNVDPNDSGDARPIVESCAKAGAYVTTVWNKPADLHPWDFGDNYIAHISYDGIPYGEQTAQVIIDAIGGKGGIIGLGGIASNVPAIERKQGLMNVINNNPNVELLDFQDADWDSSKAYDVVSSLLTRFGNKIKGIWAANDGMALGALEALRSEGLAGEIPITGIDGTRDAIDAVRSGELAATVDWDPVWLGGIGLALGYHAAMGTFKLSNEPKKHREFYAKGVLITQDDVVQYFKEKIDQEPVYNWDDLFGRVVGQIQYR